MKTFKRFGYTFKEFDQVEVYTTNTSHRFIVPAVGYIVFIGSDAYIVSDDSRLCGEESFEAFDKAINKKLFPETAVLYTWSLNIRGRVKGRDSFWRSTGMSDVKLRIYKEYIDWFILERSRYITVSME